MEVLQYGLRSKGWCGYSKHQSLVPFYSQGLCLLVKYMWAELLFDGEVLIVVIQRFTGLCLPLPMATQQCSGAAGVLFVC